MKRFTFLFLASWLYGDMNFEDLISKAINHHPSIQMSQEAFKMSEEELNSAKWQYFPTPSVDFSNSTKNDQVVAKLEQPLWTGGKLDSQYDIALSSKAEAGYTLEESKYRLVERILNLLQAYSQGKSAEISLKEGYDRLSKFSEMIDRRVDSGISSQSDEILLNSRLIQIKSDLINAKSKKTLALKQLSLIIGENIESINFNLDKFNFDNIQSSVLIDDMAKFHPTLKKIYAPKEEFCWKKIYGQNEICSWCTIFKLTNDKKIVSTFFDESSDTWLQAHDELIAWTNGKVVKCTIAIDVTEQKEMQSSLIQAHTKLARQTKELIEANGKYELLAKTDYLTGINNRRNFFCLGEALYANDLECKEEIFIAIIDLDNFKQLNDTYGHHLGDKALIAFTQKVEQNIDKRTDIFGRIGGEEFGLIVKASSENEIFLKVDFIRKAIEEITLIEHSQKINITVSIGLVCRQKGETLDMTLEKADKMLYEAKNNGRNKVKFRL